MRYKIRHKGKSIEIRSENAALTHKLQSKALLSFLSSYREVGVSLDYGCGKLRYMRNIRKFSQSVVAVDSLVQLNRKQAILDKEISIREYVQRHWNDVNVLDVQ